MSLEARESSPSDRRPRRRKTECSNSTGSVSNHPMLCLLLAASSERVGGVRVGGERDEEGEEMCTVNSTLAVTVLEGPAPAQLLCRLDGGGRVGVCLLHGSSLSCCAGCRTFSASSSPGMLRLQRSSRDVVLTAQRWVELISAKNTTSRRRRPAERHVGKTFERAAPLAFSCLVGAFHGYQRAPAGARRRELQLSARCTCHVALGAGI